MDSIVSKAATRPTNIILNGRLLRINMCLNTFFLELLEVPFYIIKEMLQRWEKRPITTELKYCQKKKKTTELKQHRKVSLAQFKPSELKGVS